MYVDRIPLVMIQSDFFSSNILLLVRLREGRVR